MKRYNSNLCDSISAQLSAYYDKQVPVWNRHLINRHLDRCPECATKYNTIQQTDEFLQFVTPVKASDEFLSGVLKQAIKINKANKTKQLSMNRFSSYFDCMQVWLRGKIRTYNPLFMLGFVFGVIIMIGATLYSPRIERFNPFPQSLIRSAEAQQDKVISFEVISQQEPKRTLKNR